jgi:hypothetical protein
MATLYRADDPNLLTSVLSAEGVHLELARSSTASPPTKRTRNRTAFHIRSRKSWRTCAIGRNGSTIAPSSASPESPNMPSTVGRPFHPMGGTRCEHAAYGRIEAARVARRVPLVLDRLADGSVNPTTVGLLAPHLSRRRTLPACWTEHDTGPSATLSIWLQSCARSPRRSGSCRSPRPTRCCSPSRSYRVRRGV